MRIIMFTSPQRARRGVAIDVGDGLLLVCASSPRCMRGPCARRAPVVPRQGSVLGGLARGSPAGGAEAAACRPRPARRQHGPDRVRCVAFLPARPKPIARPAGGHIDIYARFRENTLQFPSLPFFASRRRCVLINSKLESVRCGLDCRGRDGVRVARSKRGWPGALLRDGPKRSNHRAGRGIK